MCNGHNQYSIRFWRRHWHNNSQQSTRVWLVLRLVGRISKVLLFSWQEPSNQVSLLFSLVQTQVEIINVHSFVRTLGRMLCARCVRCGSRDTIGGAGESGAIFRSRDQTVPNVWWFPARWMMRSCSLFFLYMWIVNVRNQSHHNFPR